MSAHAETYARDSLYSHMHFDLGMGQFGASVFLISTLVTNSPSAPDTSSGPHGERRVRSRAGVLFHTLAMLRGVYVPPTAPTVGKPSRAGLVPHGIGQHCWPRSVLSL